MRVTSAVFLLLFLVTTAGSVLPRFGEQRSAAAVVTIGRLIEQTFHIV